MFLLEWLVDGANYIGAFFHDVADNVPDVNVPLIGNLLDFIEDRMDDIGDAFEWLAEGFDDIADWFELIHDAALFIIDLIDIKDWLEDVLGIADFTYGWLSLRLIDGFKWWFNAADDVADGFVSALSDALKRAFDILDLSGDALAYAVGAILEEVLEPGAEFFLDLVDNLWDELGSVGGAVEKWLLARADWLRDNVLNLGTWMVLYVASHADDFLETILDFPEWVFRQIAEGTEWVRRLSEHALWGFLNLIVNTPTTFIELVIQAVRDTFEEVAESIIDLATDILDFAWGD